MFDFRLRSTEQRRASSSSRGEHSQIKIDTLSIDLDGSERRRNFKGRWKTFFAIRFLQSLIIYNPRNQIFWYNYCEIQPEFQYSTISRKPFGSNDILNVSVRDSFRSLEKKPFVEKSRYLEKCYRFVVLAMVFISSDDIKGIAYSRSAVQY